MRMLPERLDYLWFFGFALEDEIPDHSVLSKARGLGGVRVTVRAHGAAMLGGAEIRILLSLCVSRVFLSESQPGISPFRRSYKASSLTLRSCLPPPTCQRKDPRPQRPAASS
jgi:hypothetical protein